MNTWKRVVTAFHARAEAICEQAGVPGMAIGAAVSGEPVHLAGIGHANLAHDLPMTVDTVLGIGSVTKSMTAVAITQLHERGKLSVHDPVVRHLPSFRLPGRSRKQMHEITIHHLLTHTSGLPQLPHLFRALAPSLRADPTASWHGIPIDVEAAAPLLTTDMLLTQLATDDYALLGPPGAWLNYSNEGYALLGAIVEAAAGQPYEAYVTEHILQPASMRHSSFIGREPAAAPPAVTELYGVNPASGRPEPAPGWWYSEPFSAAGFVRSTVTDLLRYMDLFRTGGRIGSERLLSAESVAVMTAMHHETAPGLGYGCALHVSPDYHGLRIIEHGGGIKGTSAWVCCVPEHDVTFVVLANMAGVASDAPVTAALNAMVGLPPDKLRLAEPAASVRSSDVSSLTGTFEAADGGSVQIDADGEAPVFKLGDTDVPLQPLAADTFLLPLGSGSVVRLHRQADGSVDRLSAGFPSGFRMFIRSSSPRRG